MLDQKRQERRDRRLTRGLGEGVWIQVIFQYFLCVSCCLPVSRLSCPRPQSQWPCPDHCSSPAGRTCSAGSQAAGKEKGLITQGGERPRERPGEELHLIFFWCGWILPGWLTPTAVPLTTTAVKLQQWGVEKCQLPSWGLCQNPRQPLAANQY